MIDRLDIGAREHDVARQVAGKKLRYERQGRTLPTKPDCGIHAIPQQADHALDSADEIPYVPGVDGPSPDSPATDSSTRASTVASTVASTRHWNARLEVGVAMRGASSVAVHRRHIGPLRLQKPLYPEGPGVAHLLVVHPPAGIAGGDRLEIDIDMGNEASALVTTPGATKWYRSDGARAYQHVALTIARGACLEWLPQENIVFDGADVETSTTIACERGAMCIGWDIVVLGRLASGERFERGAVRQDLSLSCDGRLLWRERARLAAGDGLLGSPVGWNGHSVAGVFWAWGTTLPVADLERCRGATMARQDAGVTVLGDGLVVARALSDSTESVRDLFHEIWTIIRVAMTARGATLPRIWAT